MRFLFKTTYAQDIRLAKHGGHVFWYGLLCALLVAAPMLVSEYLLAQLTFHFRRVERLIDGTPQVLVRDGQVNSALMRKELLSTDDLEAALRAGGCLHLHEVERATIETNGQITVVLRRRESAAGG